jgi:hypothetical protein
VGHQISVNFEKFDVIQALLIIVVLPLIIVIEIWHYSMWQFKNLFYTPIFLLQMSSSFDKGRIWLGLNIHYVLTYTHSLQPTILNDVNRFKSKVRNR